PVTEPPAIVDVLNQRIKDPVPSIVPVIRARVPITAVDIPKVRLLPFKSIFPSVIVKAVATVTAFTNWIPAPELLFVTLAKFSAPVLVMVCRVEPLNIIVLVPAVKVPLLLQLPA